MRETTERKAAESAIRESEARYRTLVENAPEAIVVFDMDVGRFVECNENAVRFFKMTRDELLAVGPDKISPPFQQDGSPSFGVVRGHLDRALAGDAPSFEWMHRDALGHDIPCEVRLVRLPSSGRRLIRGSITDITERKRSELLAVGDRRVFERITSNTDLAVTLEAITETAEKVTPDAFCTVSVYEADTNTLHHVAGTRLPPEYLQTKQRLEIGPRNGSCAAAIFLHRQVIVAEITRDALWEHRAHRGRRGRPAGLLVHADARLRRPHARHRGALLQAAAQPAAPRFRTDEPADRARRRSRSSASARRKRCATAKRSTAACSTTSSKASTARPSAAASRPSTRRWRRCSATTRSTTC